MNIKPTDFFIGVTDFFSVILPGAVIAYFLQSQYYSQFFGEGRVFQAPAGEAGRWIAFILVTYIAGNLVFVIASFLDKWVYDKLLMQLFIRNKDYRYKLATAIRDQYIPIPAGTGQPDHVVNTYKWALSYLSLKHPETMTDIKKFEADSKFFRSLFIVFAVIGIILMAHMDWSSLYFLVLALLSLYRYGDLRYKSTDRACELIITLHRLEKSDSETIMPVETTLDNRADFIISEGALAPYKDKIATITKGLPVSTEAFAIPTNKILNIKSLNKENFFCISGGTTIMTDTGTKEHIIIQKNAIIPLSPAGKYDIKNTHAEPLILLSVKYN